MISSIPLHPLLHFTSFVDYIGLLHLGFYTWEHVILGLAGWIGLITAIFPPNDGIDFFLYFGLEFMDLSGFAPGDRNLIKKRMESATGLISCKLISDHLISPFISR